MAEVPPLVSAAAKLACAETAVFEDEPVVLEDVELDDL